MMLDAGEPQGANRDPSRQARKTAGDGFDGEVEVAAIVFPSRPLSERKVGFTILKEHDEAA